MVVHYHWYGLGKNYGGSITRCVHKLRERYVSHETNCQSATNAIRMAVIQNINNCQASPNGQPHVYAKFPFMDDEWLVLPESQWNALIRGVVELRISFHG